MWTAQSWRPWAEATTAEGRKHGVADAPFAQDFGDVEGLGPSSQSHTRQEFAEGWTPQRARQHAANVPAGRRHVSTGETVATCTHQAGWAAPDWGTMRSAYSKDTSREVVMKQHRRLQKKSDLSMEDREARWVRCFEQRHCGEGGRAPSQSSATDFSILPAGYRPIGGRAPDTKAPPTQKHGLEESRRTAPTQTAPPAQTAPPGVPSGECAGNGPTITAVAASAGTSGNRSGGQKVVVERMHPGSCEAAGASPPPQVANRAASAPGAGSIRAGNSAMSAARRVKAAWGQQPKSFNKYFEGDEVTSAEGGSSVTPRPTCQGTTFTPRHVVSAVADAARRRQPGRRPVSSRRSHAW